MNVEGTGNKATENVRNGCLTLLFVLGLASGNFKFFLLSKCPYNLIFYIVFTCLFYFDNLKTSRGQGLVFIHIFIY